MTTATGWTADRSRFLVPGGFVDADGYHDDDPAVGIPQVDRGGCEGAQWLGLRRLPAEQLLDVKRHVVGELLRLHEPAVMRSLLGAAALAPLRAFAAPKSRPVIWLLGLTGSGKTFLASLLMNFFGDYPLDASGRIATWNSTGQLAADARLLPQGLPGRHRRLQAGDDPARATWCGCSRTPATGRPAVACGTT